MRIFLQKRRVLIRRTLPPPALPRECLAGSPRGLWIWAAHSAPAVGVGWAEM